MFKFTLLEQQFYNNYKQDLENAIDQKKFDYYLSDLEDPYNMPEFKDNYLTFLSDEIIFHLENELNYEGQIIFMNIIVRMLENKFMKEVYESENSYNKNCALWQENEKSISSDFYQTQL